jgi:hypothetical protein
VPDLLGNRLLKVPSGFTTSTSNGYTVLATSVALNGPNSLDFGNGQLLGVNTGDANVFAVACEIHSLMRQYGASVVVSDN